MDCFKYFIVFLLTLLIDQTFGFVISLNKNAELSKDLEINLNLGTINAIVTLNRPDGSSAGNCLAPLGGVSGGCTSGLTQDLTNGVTTFSIASVSRATDEGEWTSSQGSDTGSLIITVFTIPAAITEQGPAVADFEVTTSTSKTLTVVVECAYPSAQIDWEFVTETSASTGISPTRNTCTDMGLTGGSCSDAAAKTFHCDFTVTETSTASLSAGKYKLKANLYMDGEVTSTGISVELSTIITIPAGSTTTNVLAALGIVVAVVCVALCWIMFFQLSGRLPGPCPVFIKSKLSVKQTFIAAVIVTLLCVIGIILCIVGLVTKGLAYAGAGFALAVIALVIIMLLLVCCRVNAKKNFHESPNLGDHTTEERLAMKSDPLLEEKAKNPIH